jgi:amidase
LLHDPFFNLPLHPECLIAVKEVGRLLEATGHIVEESFPVALTGPTGLGEALGIIASSGIADRLGAWEERTGRQITPQDVEPGTWRRVEQGRQYTAVQIHSAIRRLAAGVCRCPEWWSAGMDLLVTPTMQSLPPITGLPEQEYATTFGLYTMPWSITGQPAISLPVHWSDGGLPVGVQLVASYGREDILIRVAAQLETAMPWADRWPDLTWVDTQKRHRPMS